MIGKPIIYTDKNSVPKDLVEIDAYTSALGELFSLAHPHLKSSMPGVREQQAAYVEEQQKLIPPIWVHYPWAGKVVRSVPEDLYFKLRTARNKEVITLDEQDKYRALTVGVAGLSVGSAVVSALVMSGGPKQIKIADFDVLEATNLNRIRGTLLDIGSEKTDIAARNVWELDPFANLDLYPEGLTEENVERFLSEPKLDVFVDEMEAINFKILSRIIAKKNGTPVLMATDNGDGILLDIERFDLEPERPIFHGLIGEMTVDEVKNLDYRQWLRLATKIVGPEYLTPHMQSSILSIGKTIPSVPQLGASATVAGAAVSYAIRALAAGRPLPSGRHVISFEERLMPDFMQPAQVQAREEQTRAFKAAFEK